MLRYFLLGGRDRRIVLWMTDCVLKWAPFFPYAILLFLVPPFPWFMGEEAKLYAIKGFFAVKNPKNLSVHLYYARIEKCSLPSAVYRLQGTKTQIIESVSASYSKQYKQRSWKKEGLQYCFTSGFHLREGLGYTLSPAPLKCEYLPPHGCD